jgi:hypothetical protein
MSKVCEYCAKIQLSSMGLRTFKEPRAKAYLSAGWIPHPDGRPSLVLQCGKCKVKA